MEYSKQVYDAIKEPFVRFCSHRKITANQLTVFNHAITLLFATYFFAQGTYLFSLWGLAVCLINGFIDYLDGDVARLHKKNNAALGSWLDTGFDAVLQTAVLGAIALGCYRQGLWVNIIILFFIGNSASQFVSFHYNQKFGFDSCKGNKMFRDYMDNKKNPFNRFMKTLIDPTSDGRALALYTYRYWIVLGCVLNIMPVCFVIITIINNIRWSVMFIIYALYLHEGYDLYILQALSILDEEKNEFYILRHCE